MLNYHDQIAKRVLEYALDARGDVALEVEAPLLAPQRLDLWFKCNQAAARGTRSWAWLDRMAEETCGFEPYSVTPPFEKVLRGCLRKQVNWYEHLCQQARRKDLPEPAMPRQWILSPGRPEEALRELEFRPAQGWPEGFYHAAPALRMYCVVAQELPRVRETVLLRLLCGSELRTEAIGEIRAIPATDPEHSLLTDLLAGVKHIIELDPRVSEPEKKDFMTAAVRAFQQFKQELRQEGHDEGIRQGLRENILAVLRTRGVSLHPEDERRIRACEDQKQLSQWLIAAVTVPSADQIFSDPADR